MTRFVFVRHGESEHNLKLDTHIGGLSIHSRLTELGRQQARDRGKLLNDERYHFDHAYYSPALRTTKTVEEILLHGSYHLTPIADDHLLEMRLGEHEGKLRRDVYTPDVIAQLDRDGIYGALPGAESIATVQDRMLDFIDTRTAEHPDATLLVVGHGLAIRSLIGKILHLQKQAILSMVTDNASVSIIETDGEEYRVAMIGNKSVNQLH